MSFVYNKAASLVGEWTDPGTDLRLMLVTAAYTPDRDHDFVSQVVAAELVASAGYVAGFSGSGRQALANWAITEDDAGDRAVIKADHPVWPVMTTGQQIAAMILYVKKTSDADSYLVAYFNSGDFPTPSSGINTQDFMPLWPNGDAVQGEVIALPTAA